MSKDEKFELGDGPIQEQYRERMKTVAWAVDRVFNGDKHGSDRETGFVLLVFPFGEGKGEFENRVNFISNGANRGDVVSIFKEMIRRFEEQVETSGGV